MTEFEDKSAPATKKSRCDFAESYENSLSFESDGNETASDSEEEESSAQFDSADESSSPAQSTMNKTPENNCEQPYSNGVGSSRLGDCEVCARAAAKYACPECEVKTCSLHCVKIHKIELQCDGVRSRVKFRRMEKLTSLDILSDYRLLEETNRAVSTAKQSNELCLLQNRRFFGQKKGSFLIQGAQRKEIGLKLLPVSFTKRKQNSTRYLKNSNEFMWKVKWVFRQADSLEFVEHNVSDNLVIGDVVMKYFDSGKYSDPKTASRMKPYVGRGLHEVEVLLPAHGIAGTKYFIMNLKETIAENLKYKNFVEHPTFHVILDMHLGEFSFVHTVIKGKNFLEYNENDEIDQELPPE